MHKELRNLVFSLLIGLLLIFISQSVSADSSGLSVTASVLSKSRCKFQTKASALDYGTLDPSSGGDATVVTTLGFVCNGSAPSATFLISQDNGLNGTGPSNNRMQHTVLLTEFLPYSLVLSPTSATVPKGVIQTLTVTGTINAVDYQNAMIGSYSDTVVISITP